MQFVAEVLSLSASTAFAAKTVDATAPLSHLARQPSWPLLTTATSTRYLCRLLFSLFLVMCVTHSERFFCCRVVVTIFLFKVSDLVDIVQT